MTSFLKGMIVFRSIRLEERNIAYIVLSVYFYFNICQS